MNTSPDGKTEHPICPRGSAFAQVRKKSPNVVRTLFGFGFKFGDTPNIKILFFPWVVFLRENVAKKVRAGAILLGQEDEQNLLVWGCSLRSGFWVLRVLKTWSIAIL